MSPALAEQTATKSAPELVQHCGGGSRWESDSILSPFLNSATATATVDNDGNALFAFAGISCAAGVSNVSVVVNGTKGHTYRTSQ